MKKLLVIFFAVFSFAACGQQAQKNEGLFMPTINGGKVFNFTEAVSVRPVVAASMAGFCGYCKMMAPLLDQLAGEYAGKNVDFVLAFVDEDPEPVRQIAENLGLKHIRVAYNAGEFAQLMGVEGFPAIYLSSNMNGNFVLEEWGGYSPDHIAEIRAKIDELLK